MESEETGKKKEVYGNRKFESDIQRAKLNTFSKKTSSLNNGRTKMQQLFFGSNYKQNTYNSDFEEEIRLDDEE